MIDNMYAKFFERLPFDPALTQPNEVEQTVADTDADDDVEPAF